ncbi:MAG: tetratricopeptide repeat protein, partial [Parachlamydiaceae bacterium]
LGEEHPDVAASYNSIGLILDYQSKHEEALQHYAQALEMQKQLLGEEHPDVAATYSNIGGALQSQGKHEAALQHYTQALEMQKKLLGKEHLILATTYNNIGSVLSHQGKYEEALQYYAQALEMQKKLLGKEHPNVATSYHNIGGVLHSQSKHKKALRYCTQALEMRKKLLGEEHPDVASSYNNISAMHFHLAQTYKRVSPAESLKHAQKAKKHLQKYEDLQLWGKNQPQIQTFLRNKQYNKAIRSIHTLPNSLKKRPFVLCPYLQLSFVCENQKVKRLRSQILEQAEKACQTGKLKASLSLRLNLALIYIQANDWDKALKHIRMLKSCQDAITYSSLDLLLMQEDPNLAGETVPAEIMGDYLALRVFEFKGANLVVKMGCQNLLKKIESLKNKNLLIKRFERFCLDKLNS